MAYELSKNVFCSFDIDHWVYSLAADADFVMQVNAGHTSRCAHITDPIPARNTLPDFYAEF